MAVQITIRPSTIERTLRDVEEWYARVQRVREKMRVARAGGAAWVDTLPELTVELNWLREKIQSSLNVIEEFLESLPEDDS